MDIVFAIVVGAITAALAGRKGYNAGLWFLAGGVIGLIVLAFLPFVNEKSKLPEEQRAGKKTTGDVVGGALSAIAISFLAFRLLA